MSLMNDIFERTGETDNNKLIVELIKSDTVLANEFRNRVSKILGAIDNKILSEINKFSIKNNSIDIAELMGQSKSQIKNNKKKFEATQKDILDNLEDIAKNTKVDVSKASINISDMFKIEPTQNASVSRKFNKTQKLILDNINLQLRKEQIDFKLGSTMFKLDKLFNVPTNMGFMLSSKFNKMRSNVLDRISSSTKNIDIKFKQLSLNDFFGVAPKMGFWSSNAFKITRLDLLAKISNTIKKTEFDFSKEPLTLNDFFGVTPKMGFWSSFAFKMNRMDLLIKMSNAIKKTEFEFSKKPLTLTDFFGITPKMGIISKSFYQYKMIGVINEFSKKLKADIKNLPPLKSAEQATGLLERLKGKGSGLMGKIGTGLGNMAGNMAGRSKVAFQAASIGTQSFFDKKQNVTVDEFSKPALKQLQKLKGKDVTSVPVKDEKPEWLKKILGPVSLVLGGLGALVAGLMSSGPARGFLKILSKEGLKGGFKLALKNISKTLGKQLGKNTLKRIPIIGSIVSFGFAVDSFRRGDIIEGSLDLISGLVGLIPGAGPFLSLGVDVLNTFLAIKTGGTGKEQSAKKLSILSNWRDKFVDQVKGIPIVRDLLNFSSGLGKLSAGDWKGGLKDLAMSIPFVSPMVEFIEATTKAGFETYKETKAEGGGFMDGMKKFYDKMVKAMKIGLINRLPKFMQGSAAKILGIDGYKNPEEIKITSENKRNTKKEIDRIIKERNVLFNQMQNYKDVNPELYSKNYQKWQDLQIKKQSLENNLSKMNDFIWRPGKQPREFSSQDTLIGAKEGISLKEGKDIHLGIQEMKNVLENVNKSIDKLVNLTNQTLQVTSQPKQQGSSLDGIPASAGFSREPASDKAYGFRTRAWEILHGVT